MSRWNVISFFSLMENDRQWWLERLNESDIIKLAYDLINIKKENNTLTIVCVQSSFQVLLGNDKIKYLRAKNRNSGYLIFIRTT